MADQNTEVSLDTLHDVMVQQIQAQFPTLQTVEFYRTDYSGLPIPACLLEMTEMENEPAEDAGTDQIAVKARFEARFIIGFKTPNAKREIRKLAAAFAAWVKFRKWPGAPSGEAEVIGCYDDHFEPALEQYEVWRVEWTQLLFLGANVWLGGGILPSTVMLGYAPLIGLGHETDYVQVVPES